MVLDWPGTDDGNRKEARSVGGVEIASYTWSVSGQEMRLGLVVEVGCAAGKAMTYGPRKQAVNQQQQANDSWERAERGRRESLVQVQIKKKTSLMFRRFVPVKRKKMDGVRLGGKEVRKAEESWRMKHRWPGDLNDQNTVTLSYLDSREREYSNSR